jgi:hypothetical protein
MEINGFILDRELLDALGLNKATFICMMYDKYQFYKKQNLLDADGYFYISRPDMMKETGLGLTIVTKYTKEFSNAGILGVQIINAGNKANRYTLLTDSKEYILKNMQNNNSPIPKNMSPIQLNISPIPLNMLTDSIEYGDNHIINQRRQPDERTNRSNVVPIQMDRQQYNWIK